MVYQCASSSLGAISSRVSLGAVGAMSAMPTSSGRSASSLWLFSSIVERLGADDAAHHLAEAEVEHRDPQRDGRGDDEHHERVRDSLPSGGPDDVRELFADVLQVGDECGHGG